MFSSWTLIIRVQSRYILTSSQEVMNRNKNCKEVSTNMTVIREIKYVSIYLFDFHAVTLRQPCEMTWQFPVMTSESKYSCNESFLRDSFLCCLLCYFTWWQPHFLYQKRAIRVRQSESYLECNSSTPAVAHTNCILVNELKNTKAKEKLSQSCSKDTK